MEKRRSKRLSLKHEGGGAKPTCHVTNPSICSSGSNHKVPNSQKAALLSYSRAWKPGSPFVAKRGKFIEQNDTNKSEESEHNFQPYVINQTQVEPLTHDEVSVAEPALSEAGMALTEMVALAWNDSCDDCEDEVASSFNTALVSVDGYGVKEEFVPLVRKILKKHKDIVKNCSLQSVTSRSMFLEMVCALFHRLEKSNFKHITTVDLKSMLHEVADMESIGMEIEWIRLKLDEIYQAKIKYKDASSIKEARTRIKEAIENSEMEIRLDGMILEVKQDEVAHLQVEIRNLHGEIIPLREKIYCSYGKLMGLKAEDKEIDAAALDSMTKVNAVFNKSFVDGLL